MFITDLQQTFSQGKRQTDSNGFVDVPAVITKVGVQDYLKGDLRAWGVQGVVGGDNEAVGVFRPSETVFHDQTIASFRAKPVTDDHPPIGVTPKTAKMFMGGHVGDDTRPMDDTTLGATIHLQDEDFISRSKGSQTSAGYEATIIKDSGTYEGRSYDFRFDGPMKGNHLALVAAARCGSGCRVLDTKFIKENGTMEEKDVQALIDKALKAQTDALTATVGTIVKDALTAHKKEIADSEKAAKDEKAKVEDAKKQLENAKVDTEKIVRDQIALETKVNPLIGDAYKDGMTKRELLEAATEKIVKDSKDKSDDYLEAMLDADIERRAKAGTGKIGDAAISGTVYDPIKGGH